MKKRLKINGVIMFCAFLLVAVFPAVFLRDQDASRGESFSEVLGIGLILLGQIFRISARGYKAESSQSGKALICGGPYALVRNPMYLGILLIGLGVVLVLFQWWAASIFLVVFVVRYILLIFKEEKKLKWLFPEEFAVYQKKTPRILPSLAALSRQDIAEYLPLRLSWVKKEIGSVLTVLILAVFLESWEDIGNGGVILYLRELAAILVTIILFIVITIYLSRITSRNRDAVSEQSKDNSK
jgi:protein-S-isoprenylcysteine O-methyltransferase Ste14